MLRILIFMMALSGATSVLGQTQTGAISDEEVKLSSSQINLVGLKTAVAEEKVLSTEISLNGEVTPDQDKTLQILPKAAGVVVEVRKALGDDVKTNDWLAVIESQEIPAASATYLVARSKVELAQQQLQRDETLWKKSVISEETYLTTKQAATEASVQLRAAGEKLALLGIDPAKLSSTAPPAASARVPVVAPTDGTIIEKKVAVGDQVTEQTPLFRLANLDKVWVIANAFERDMGKLAIGQSATVRLRAYPDRTFRGKVTWVSRVVDERTRTLAVRVELDNRDRLLKPGSFARVFVSIPMQKSAVSVPAGSVQRHDNNEIVFVDAGNGIYKLRRVTTNLRAGGDVEILSGVKAGEKVVTDGSFILKSELEKSSFGEE
ncbi:MAG TPA: efflux RND transporter periplasmic adaptor subunit [Rhizomicrobium sp.]|nr:efflux RND transporter periplasmic adaptor subunit [Rhizomicrobium sp.]